MAEQFDPYRIWLGIPADEQPPNHYHLLGVGLFESDPEVIANAADRQMGHVRTFQTGKHSRLSQKLLNELSAARICLLNPKRKADYDAWLRGQLDAAQSPVASPGKPVVPPEPVTSPPQSPQVPVIPQVRTSQTSFGTTARRPARRGQKSFLQNPAWQAAIVSALVVAALLLLVALWSSRPTASPAQRRRPATDSQAGSFDTDWGTKPWPELKPEENPSLDTDGDPGTEGSGGRNVPSQANGHPVPASHDNAGAETGGPPTLDAAPTRLRVPDADSQKLAEDLIRNETFQADFVGSSHASRKAALAKKLLEAGSNTGEDPASAYVLLRMARDLASELDDLDTALAAIGELAGRFEVRASQMKLKAMESAAQSAGDRIDNQILADEIVPVVDEAIAEDDLQTAESLLALANSVVPKAGDKSLERLLAVQAKQIEEIKPCHAEYLQARSFLDTVADDAQAHQSVGRYLCFMKNDWLRGLPDLARSIDSTIQEAAAGDRADPQQPDGQLALADSWWTCADEETGTAQENIKRRAAHWYKLAEPHLTGDEKARAQQRMAEVDQARSPAAQLPQAQGLECRKGAVKTALLDALGGNPASEEAVDRALQWLAKHQSRDGSWNFDHRAANLRGEASNWGTLTNAPKTATAMALLPFLAADNGSRHGDFRKNVFSGLQFLRKKAVKVGDGLITFHEPDAQSLPSHALCSIALCEAAADQGDKATRAVAEDAVRFIVSSQSPDGGWNSKPNPPGDDAAEPSDVCTTGETLIALETARWIGIEVSDNTFDRAAGFFDSLRVQHQGNWGYRRSARDQTPDPLATAVGFSTDLRLAWGRDESALLQYVATLHETQPPVAENPRIAYHTTQLMRNSAGQAWTDWNRTVRNLLISRQTREGDEAGSWCFSSSDPMTLSGGRLYWTVLATLILEVYYRHPPLGE